MSNERADQEEDCGCDRGVFHTRLRDDMGSGPCDCVIFASDISALECVQLLLIDSGGVFNDTACPETAEGHEDESLSNHRNGIRFPRTGG